MSILVKDTTREEREEIVRRSLEEFSEECDSAMEDADQMYSDYIEGRKELSEINAEYRCSYVQADPVLPTRGGGCSR